MPENLKISFGQSQAVRAFLLERGQSDLSDSLFNEHEISVLMDIHQVLEVAHKAQELLSAERTPTLSIALPAYELIIAKWKDLQQVIPELKSFIGQGIRKLKEYMSETRKTRMYAHAMGESHFRALLLHSDSSIWSSQPNNQVHEV